MNVKRLSILSALWVAGFVTMSVVFPISSVSASRVIEESLDSAVPYTRMWMNLTGPSGANANYFVRHSSATTYATLGVGKPMSDYQVDPANWSMLRSGSQRYFKNSATNKCLWADVVKDSDGFYDTRQSMVSCDVTDVHQLFTMNYSTYNGKQIARIKYVEDGVGFCLTSFKTVLFDDYPFLEECNTPFSSTRTWWNIANPR